MARTHLAFTLLVLAGLQDIQAYLNLHSGGKTLLDPKRRSEIVDETFLEQKDILLEMLETKLKEVREKRKKKSLNGDGNTTNINSILELPEKLNGKNLRNVDVKMNVKGISNIGESILELNYRTGKGAVNMDAHGISNIGNMHVELGVGEPGLFMPGFNDLFVDGGNINDTKSLSTEPQTTTRKVEDSRRSIVEVTVNTTEPTTTAATHNVTHRHHTAALHRSNATTVKNLTVQVWNTSDTTGSTKIDVLPLVTVNSTLTAAANITAVSNSTATANITAVSNSTAAANNTVQNTV